MLNQNITTQQQINTYKNMLNNSGNTELNMLNHSSKNKQINLLKMPNHNNK